MLCTNHGCDVEKNRCRGYSQQSNDMAGQSTEYVPVCNKIHTGIVTAVQSQSDMLIIYTHMSA